MENIAIEHKPDDPDVIYRVIMKIHDDFYIRKEDKDFFPAKTTHWVDSTTIIPYVPIQKLFTSISPGRIAQLTMQARAMDPGYCPPNFLNYFTIHYTSILAAHQALKQLWSNEVVECAYLETNSAPLPAVSRNSNPLQTGQTYLNPAPAGIDATYAWRFKGGDGCGSVHFIDIEQGWIKDHEDVPVHTLPGSGINHLSFKDHGTAVLGIITMQDNEVGGIGITPNAQGYMLSQWRPDRQFNLADALLTAIHYLSFGDVLLVQSQAYDPDIKKSLPVEIFDANFQLIRLATALGIIVVEPAGNGNDLAGHDLDMIANRKGHTFLNRSDKYFKDSGAIIVAAATSRTPHERINFSNYGSRIDCYSWGENVMTGGNFPDASGGSRSCYTKEFSGTSSASAIITGAILAIQSIAEANLRCKYDPLKMRTILSDAELGTYSASGHAIDKIGVMPDLKKIITVHMNLKPAFKETIIDETGTSFTRMMSTKE